MCDCLVSVMAAVNVIIHPLYSNDSSINQTVSSGNITWTGAQTFRDNRWTMTDNTDTTKAFVFEASSITPGATRTLTVPDVDGTIAIQSYVTSYVQTTGQNSQGAKTVSTADPTGGSDGDIWYKYV